MAINKAKDITRSFWRRNHVFLDEYTETLRFKSPESEDLGGIQTRIRGWIHGEQQVVDVISDTEGTYTFSWTEDGVTQEFSGDGVSMDSSGEQTALSAEEVLEAASTSVET